MLMTSYTVTINLNIKQRAPVLHAIMYNYTTSLGARFVQIQSLLSALAMPES